MTGFLELDSLEKRFGEVSVTRGVSLLADKGEIVALLGPSGSGKTTVLRLTAGFEAPDAGRVVVEGRDVTRLPAEQRRFGMVFQHYALFPHMTAGENVAFGLESRRTPRDAIVRRVAEMLALTGLSGLENRKVTELSGGQQQRVALARALAPSPRVLLLDEPLSNLDPSLREKTRQELKRAIRKIGITTVFVTHEQEEAFALGDRVAVLHAGRLEQVGTPEELFERPKTRFVAAFVGRSSVLPAVWKRPEARIRNGPVWTAEEGAPVPDGAEADLIVRPEALAFAGTSAAGALPGTVVERRYTGGAAYYLVATAAGDVEVLAPAAAHREADAVAVVLSAAGPRPRVFPREA
jgi:ABC-type Fe3+/spermidine/putrescine transport system ATPase subunit